MDILGAGDYNLLPSLVFLMAYGPRFGMVPPTSQLLWVLCILHDPVSFCAFTLFFLKSLFFNSNFKFTAKLRGKYRDFPYTSCPYKCRASSITNTHKRVTFVTSDEPTLAPHYQPKSIVYLRVHAPCCTFCGSGECIMTCIHLYSNTEYFLCPKNPPCSSIPDLPSP
uniref:Uncharacterized protein n=1 Tax=Molossus molossus TaxID=27622 RepID=A0A7J8DTS2_MOLMO|nr:hypothetical protein HJG59_009097 [Molossus molossus]